MDSQYAIDTSSLITEGSLIASKKKLKNEQLSISKIAYTDKANPKNIVKDGLIAEQKLAKISLIILLSLGISETLIGYWGGSIVAIADGIDSFSGAMLSLIVLLGLRIANRPPNKKFPYGYHKVESFAALMAAIGMIIIGAIIFYSSYQALIHPHEITQPVITMVMLAVAGFISFHRSFQMRNLANKYNLLSLKKYATNSIKDGSASIIGFFSVRNLYTIRNFTNGCYWRNGNCSVYIFCIVFVIKKIFFYIGRFM